MPERTPSQTVGPYLHLGLAPTGYNFRELFGATLAAPGLPGTHIRIEGRLSDGEGMCCLMPWSRSGRPMRKAATPIPPMAAP